MSGPGDIARDSRGVRILVLRPTPEDADRLAQIAHDSLARGTDEQDVFKEAIRHMPLEVVGFMSRESGTHAVDEHGEPKEPLRTGDVFFSEDAIRKPD